MESLVETFRAEINGFIERTGMKPTDFGRLVVGDPNFVFGVLGGRSCRVDTVDKVRKFMADYEAGTPVNGSDKAQDGQAA